MKKALLISIAISISNVYAAETYTVATYRHALPFNYLSENGVLTGFEYDLLQEIAKSQNIEIKVVPAHFPQVFKELADGKVDAIGHAYYSKSREQTYTLSDPIYTEKLEFVGLKTNEEKIKNLDGDNPIYIATSLGSPMEKVLDEIIKAHPNIKKTDTRLPFLGFKSLFMKSADLLFNTQATISTYQRNYAQYEYIKIPIEKDFQQTMSLHIMANKNNRGKEFVDYINDGLKIEKNNGTYQRLLEKYHLL